MIYIYTYSWLRNNFFTETSRGVANNISANSKKTKCSNDAAAAAFSITTNGSLSIRTEAYQQRMQFLTCQDAAKGTPLLEMKGKREGRREINKTHQPLAHGSDVTWTIRLATLTNSHYIRQRHQLQQIGVTQVNASKT